VAADLDNCRVVDEAIDRGDGHYLVGEDPVPLGEWLVGGDDQAPGFVAVSDELEQDLRLLFGDIGRCKGL
jgi:hypothetical protein